MVDEWISPNSIVPVSSNEIQIWRLTLADSELLVEQRKVLSLEEQARAERRLPGRVRDEFICGRVALRRLLAKNLGVSPQAVSIAYDQHGKPRLSQECDISFNVSHSHGMLLFALSRRGNIGIDIEYVDATTEIIELAPMVFSPGEMEKLISLPEIQGKRSLFYRTWVRKEAIVKVDGRGLFIPLPSFDVPRGEALGAPVSLADKCYFLYDIGAIEGFQAAIASESHDCRITLQDFPVSA